MMLYDIVKKELVGKELTSDVIVDVTLLLMKEVEKSAVPGVDKKDLVLSTMRTVVSDMAPDLILIADSLPHMIDVFVSLNKRDVVIKVAEKSLPFCLKFCCGK